MTGEINLPDDTVLRALDIVNEQRLAATYEDPGILDRRGC